MRSFLALLLPALALAQTPPNRLSTEERAAGWRLLFDGQTMDGWSKPHFPNTWTIEDGCLKSVANPRLREDLISLQAYGDFELAWEWKVAPGSNSGVKYKIQQAVLIDEKQLPHLMPFEEQVAFELTHQQASYDKVTPGGGAQVYPVAFEYQLIDDATHPDAKAKAESRAGALYSMVAPSRAAARPVGEWNQSRIVLRGLHVEHWLNGVKVVETDLDAPAVRAHIEKRWANAERVRKLLIDLPKARCPVSLQHHNDVAWFRNIRVLELK
jgi:hypothetical protein